MVGVVGMELKVECGAELQVEGWMLLQVGAGMKIERWRMMAGGERTVVI